MLAESANNANDSSGKEEKEEEDTESFNALAMMAAANVRIRNYGMEGPVYLEFCEGSC